MNERVAQAGNQIKDAFQKVLDAWNRQEAARRRRILIIGLGLIVLAVGLVIVLNVMNSRYTVLYENMTQDESVTALGVLQAAEIPAKITNGKLEVPQKNISQAMGALALQGIPSTTLDYNVLAEASGLTTTEREKREYQKAQWQDRLQDTIKTLDGVQNAYVTLSLPEDTNRVWDTSLTKGSGSATVHMQPGYVLSVAQANAIRHLIGPSVGIDPSDVAVLDGNGNLLAAAGESYDLAAAATSTFLERADLAKAAEERLVQKAASILYLPYPDSEDWTIACTVTMDFDAMVTEIKEYFPLEGTNAGVLDEEEINAQMGLGQYTEGVVGETDNTDVPIYVDLDGDGVAESVDYHHFRDYAVSYTLQQIEKDGPHVTGTALSVVINDTLNNETRQLLRDSIASATGLTVDQVTVNGFLVPGTGEPETPGIVGDGPLGLPWLFWYIAIAALVVLIIVLVLVIILRRRAKKKKLAAELAAEEAARLEAERIQAEIEERKNQLKSAAIGDPGEDAISNEVREFAKNNPEITATLLRNWLKEGD